MEQYKIIEELENNGIKVLTTQTIKDSYTIIGRGSLDAAQVHNRDSARWKKAQYIIINKDDISSLTKSNLDGWKSLANLDQFLITCENGDWQIYDNNGNKNIFKSLFKPIIVHIPIQKIYFGTPGSGKSHKVNELVRENAVGNNENIFRTTFHPDSDYATFVGCYKPTMIDDNIKYQFVPQIFTDAYIYAYKHPDKPTYLIIEEINRGNCAQIFGDLFQLLDRKEDGTSSYPIDADKDLIEYLIKELGEESRGIKGGKLSLPANLSIIATMNTSDQSLFPMDSAFKRRWEWEYVPIELDDKEVDSTHYKIQLGDKFYKWVDFLAKVNERIKAVTDSEDKQLGNFFVKVQDKVIDENLFLNKIMSYLWFEICKDNYHTADNFFRYKEDKKEKEFSFNEIFSRKELLPLFMEYLEIKEN